MKYLSHKTIMPVIVETSQQGDVCGEGDRD